MFSEGFPSFQNQLFFKKHNTSNYLFSHHFQDRNEWFDYCNLSIRLLSPSLVFCRHSCQELSRNIPGNSNILGCTMFRSCPHSYIDFPPLQIPSYPCFFSSSLFFCAAYSFIFISHFNLLSPSSMLYVPSKGAAHTQQILQFLKSNRTCSWGWILLASKCPWFTLGVQGAHNWVHYKLVTMSLMSQMPWEYFRSQEWAWCLCRKRNAFITCTAICLLLQMGDAEPERAACLKLHSKWQERNGTLAPHGGTGQTEAEEVNCSSKLGTACGLTLKE